MKFLCDNCKAKYQIADEKVAGKTVRMKCRKCGHQIEVRAAVTESSVSTAPPSGAPGSGGSEAPRPMAKNSLATSLSAQKPRAPMAASQSAHPQATGALAGAFQRTVQDAPQSVPFPGANAGGSALELSVTDEWYVAINGVPVGPVRISELRRKAGSGAVTEDSLCWQEGLEEWRPVRSIPELAAIVREAAQGNRPSLVSPPPGGPGTEGGRASSPSSPPRAPQRPAPLSRTPEPLLASQTGGQGAPSPFGPPRPGVPSRSNVVPLRVAASNVDEPAHVTAPLQGGGAAAALAPSFQPHMQMQSSPAFAPQAQLQPPAPLAFSDPFGIPGGSSTNGTSASASLLPPPAYAPSQVPPASKRGVPLWFWPILLFTGVFGVAAAVFVFRQQQPQPPVVIQMPAASTPAATATEAKSEVPTPAPSAEPSASASAAPATKVAAAGGPRTTSGGQAAAPEKKGGVDVTGLLNGSGGPAVGGGSGPSAGGGGLDSSSVERVVAQHRTGVKRTCWERGGAGQPSANVTVSATVGPDGSVVGTSSSGDDPVVGKCIESQVRTWRFAAPGSTTTVNIPFKFVRQ